MLESKLKAIGNRVIAQIEEVPEVTEGGIFLPTSVKLAQKTATIVSVGTGKILPTGEREEMLLSVGDSVIIDIGPDYCAEVKYDGEVYYILEQDNVLAKL